MRSSSLPTPEPAPGREAGILGRLRAAGIRPRRRWGQNFLHDPRLLDELVEAAGLRPDEAVFEVGTGPGTLTRPLALRAREVLTVEVDPRLARFARSELADLAGVELIVGDALAGKSRLAPEVEAALRRRGPFRWVSNLPYASASPLILAVLEAGLPWRRAVLTLQREVAERLQAGPGEPAFGAVTAQVAYWAEARILRRLGAGTFWPRPRVESAAVVLEPRAPAPDPELWPAYRDWVRYLFQARRKQLGGLLRARLGAEAAERALEAGGWGATARPESLGRDDISVLARDFSGVGR